MIVVIKKWADFADHRWLCIGWFLYHFFILCLVIINIGFFIWHFNDYVFVPTDITSILLTAVGFLFAFAGINIYSIFNTNVESEKQRLIKLSEEYEAKINDSMDSMDFSKNLVRIHILGRLIVEPEKASSQFFDNLTKATNLLESTKKHVVNLKTKIPRDEYMIIETEVKDVTHGVNCQIKILSDKIATKRNQYFSGFHNPDIEKAIAELNDFQDLLKSFEDGSAFEETTSLEEASSETPSFWVRVKNVCIAIKQVFKPY